MANKKNIPIEFIAGLVCLNIKEEEDRFSQEVNIALHSLAFKKYTEDFRRHRDIDTNKFNAMIGQPSSVEIPKTDIKAERLSRKLKTLKGQRKLEKWLSEQLPKEIERRKSKEYRQRLQLLKKCEGKILKIKRWVDKRLTMDDIHKIRQRFKLSKAWDFPLTQYILTGRICKPSARCSVSLEGLPRHKRRLFIHCTWDASIDDIREVWGIVKENQEMLPDLGRKNPRIFVDNSELKIEIYKDTAIEDIRRKWSIVEQYQRNLPDFKSKSYRWKKNLMRDIKIFKSRAKSPYDTLDKIFGESEELNGKEDQKKLARKRQAKKRIKERIKQ